MRVVHFALVALFCLAPPAFGQATTGEPRVALVIGNATYKEAPLVNPVNDARAFSRTLRDAGFEVIEVHNAGAIQMRRAIRDFGERLRQNGAGLFYYAGHGVQVRGRNFLVPVDADVRYEDEIEDQSIDVALVLGKMESAKSRVNLLILDACRNNPFARNTRSLASGLAPMEAPSGTLIAFATSPGQVASDGSRANGLYTEYLVREMAQPGIKVEDVFKRVRASVRGASQGRQVPWENTSLEGDFYFVPPSVLDTAALESERRRQQDEAVQHAVREALTRSREENERDRRRLEKQYAEKLETEREVIRKEALERLALLEKSAFASTRPTAQPAPLDPPATSSVAIAPLEKAKPLKEPTISDAAEPEGDETEKTNRILDLVLLGHGIDPQRLNKPRAVSDEVARALAPSRPLDGDRWTYAREIRDDAPTIRRNYLIVTAAFANDDGYTAAFSDASVPARYDKSGNRFSSPNVAPHRGANVVFEPVDALYRYPPRARGDVVGAGARGFGDRGGQCQRGSEGRRVGGSRSSGGEIPGPQARTGPEPHLGAFPRQQPAIAPRDERLVRARDPERGAHRNARGDIARHGRDRPDLGTR
jgi:uncharacterized caspase-like protein